MEGILLENININNFDYYLIKGTILNDEIPLSIKKNVIFEYSDKIADFNQDFIIDLFTCLSFELCQCCSKFIKKIIEAMDMEFLIKIFYIGFQPRKLSDIANYLVNQEWFTNNKKYEKILVAYDLIKANNYSDENKFNEKQIIDYGYYITELLFEQECNVVSMNVILLNYLELIKKEYPFYFNDFIKEGYKKINAFIHSGIMLNQNMMIFDCHVTAKLLDIKSFYYVDFDNSVDDSCYGSYNEAKITLYTDLIKELYDEYSSKIVYQRLFHIIAHEIIHADQDDYIYGIKKANDNLTKLRIYNCVSSDCLHQINDDLYSKNHDNFYIEFDANIRAMEILYWKYQFLPSLKDNDKDECSKIFAKGLFDSYQNTSDGNIKLSPIQFVRLNLKDNIDNYLDCIYADDEEFLYILKYRSSILNDVECSLNTFKENINFRNSELLKIENNLTDYERFILGYDNSYLELLEMIASGDIYLPHNLLKSIPIYYELNEEHIEKKYNFYQEITSEKKKIYEKKFC